MKKILLIAIILLFPILSFARPQVVENLANTQWTQGNEYLYVEMLAQEIVTTNNVTFDFRNVLGYNHLDFSVEAVSAGTVTTANVQHKMTNGTVVLSETLTSGTAITDIEAPNLTVTIYNYELAPVTITANFTCKKTLSTDTIDNAVTINNNLSITGNLKVGEDVAGVEIVHVYSGAVDGEILMETNNSKDASFTLMESTGSTSDSDFGIKGSGFRIRHDGGDNHIYFETGSTAVVSTIMDIDRVTGNIAIDTNTLSVDAENNRVGVRTTAPGAVMTVVTAADSDSLQIRRNSTSDNDPAVLGFRNSTGEGEANNSEIHSVRTNSPSSNDSEIYLKNTQSGALTTAIFIDTTGKVGIGTEAPQRTLSVNGDAQVTGNMYVPIANIFNIGNGSTEGDWRYRVSGNNMVFERLESSVWENKSTITP